jgi:hypothetical protein
MNDMLEDGKDEEGTWLTTAMRRAGARRRQQVVVGSGNGRWGMDGLEELLGRRRGELMPYAFH